MAEVVAHVRKIRHLSSDPLRRRRGFRQRHVRRVRRVPERIDDQYIDSSRGFCRILGHFFAIRKIRQNVAAFPTKHETRGHGSPVRQVERNNLRLAEPERARR